MDGLHLALDQLTGAIKSYDGDPPSTDYQRGHLAALLEQRSELARSLLSDKFEDVLSIAFEDGSGDRLEELHAALDIWRWSQGDAAMTDWSWWAKQADDDSYVNELRNRDEAVRCARAEYPGDAIEVIEARCWKDEIEGCEQSKFAQTRNHERLEP